MAKCLTICQPYAALIMLPDSHERAKRVENRGWPTSYRGPLLIHAGKSRAWFELDADGIHDDLYGFVVADLPFGAIVGQCELIDCVRKGDSASEKRHLWLKSHEHYEGPWCWVLANIQPFPEPIPYRGAQGLFEVPASVAPSPEEV